MNFDKLTNRSKTLVQDVVSLASSKRQQYILPEHILKVMLNDNEPVIMELITKAGGNLDEVRRRTDDALSKIPSVSGATVQSLMSQDFTRVMNEAEILADKNGDSFVTLERILQALATTETTAAGILKQSGVNPQRLDIAVNEFRKGRVADSESAEDNFEALKKYTIDVTARARDGKLDPVIGREHEIRRTIQVLSRRTKNNPVLI